MGMGNRGENIRKLQNEIGLASLSLRGKGMNKDKQAGDGMNPLHFHCRGGAAAFGKHMKALETFFIDVHNQLADALLIEEDEKKNTQDEPLEFDDLQQRSR